MKSLKHQLVHAPIYFVGAVVVALSLLIPSVSVAKLQPPVQDEGTWGEWKGLSDGFVGRRKVPPKKAKEEGIARKAARKSAKQVGSKAPSAGYSIPDERLAAKLSTVGEGLYGASLADLATILERPHSKIRKAVAKGTLALTNAGKPLSWHYDASTKMVLFAAEAYDTFYSDTNVTLLKYVGETKARPMEVVSGEPTSAFGTMMPFRDTIKFEEEPDFFFSTWATASEPDADYWFWNYLWGGHQQQLDIPLNIPSPASYGVAQLRVKLRGGTNLYSGDEHEVTAEINGNQLGTITWDGFQERDLVVDFDQSYMNSSGANTLKLSSSSIAGTHAIQWLDMIEIDYDRQPVAVNDSLWMHGVAAGPQITAGFTTAEIVVIESPISGNALVREDVSITADDAGGWSVKFDATEGADYLLTTHGAIKTVASQSEAGSNDLTLTLDQPSELRVSTNQADYLIIAPRELSQTATDLRSYRLGRFAYVKIAWLEDIYDQFSYGLADPTVIGSFMNYVESEWTVAPSHVMLLGKGTLDEKDRMGYTDSLMPVLLSSTPWTATASDDKLLGVGEQTRFAVGRLPIISDAEGLNYVSKLIAYENSVLGTELFEAVVVADDPDRAGDFHTNSDLLAAHLEDDLGFNQVTKLYHPIDPVRDRLIDSATWEVSYVTYDGHGSITQFGSYYEKFLTVSDAELLSNSSLPIFTALTCAVGDDTYPGYRSLASALVLNPSGGAIASMAPTGLSLDYDAQLLGGAFVDSLFLANTIGDAVRVAKVQTRGYIRAFMPKMYSVIGEPAVYAR